MRLYKRGKHWWVAYFNATTGRSERVSTRLTDKAAADAHGRRLERYGADPSGEAAKTATLADALNAVIEEYEAAARAGTRSKATVEFYRKRAGQVLRMIAEGALPPLLSRIEARHVDELVRRRRAEEVKDHTIAKDLIILGLALTHAKRRGEWGGDVDAIMPARFSAGYKPVERYLRPDDLWALLGELRPDRAAWVAFAVALGANYSEAQKARREDVLAQSVRIRGTKRKSRDRVVPIVHRWQRRLLDAALSALPLEGPLFTSWTKNNRDLALACDRAGIERASTNDLRRTYGTWLRATGARTEDIGAAMGHKGSRMAELVYAKLEVGHLAGLLGAGAPVVHPVYITQGHGTDSASSEHSEDAAFAAFGSDCWTRTSDPVINSPRGESVNLLSNKAIATIHDPDCAAGVHALAGLKKAGALLSVDYDFADRLRLAAEGE